jgi:hypothetical protein
MSTPKVSFSDLEDAFWDSSSGHFYWLDKQTGQVILLLDEIADVLREDGDVSQLRDWQRHMAEEMKPVLRALGELPGEETDDGVELKRVVEILGQDSREAYEVMADFAETVTNARLQNLLVGVLCSKEPFRRFKNVLLDYPVERERWFAFEELRRREAIQVWAKDEDLEINFEGGR